MEPRAIVDTGYLVALLNARDHHHAWAVNLIDSLPGPWITPEACISESVFLLEKAGRPAAQKLIQWLDQSLLITRSFLPGDLDPVAHELFRYRDRWVDFADACLCVLSDQHPALPVATVDASDFTVYFRHRRQRKLHLPPRAS